MKAQRKITLYKTLLIVVILLFSGNIYGAKVKKYTLNYCIEKTIRNNKNLLSQRELINSKRFGVSEANANLYLPSINLSSSYSYVDQGPEREDNFLISSHHNFKNSLQINYVLFAFGAFEDQKDLAKENLRLAVLEEKEAKIAMVKGVKIAYHSVLLAQEALKLREESQKNMKENLRVAYKRFRKGKKTRLEYKAIKIQYENTIPEVDNAKKDLRKAINQLFLIIGEKPVSNTENLKDYFFDGSLKGVSTVIKEKKVVKRDLKSLIEKAKANRVEIKKLKAQRGIAELGAELASKGDKPTLALFASAETTTAQKVDFTPVFTGQGAPEVTNKFQTDYNWAVGIQLSIPLSEIIYPLFTDTVTSSKAKSAKSQVRAISHSLSYLKDSVEKEITDNYTNLQVTEQNIKAREKVKNLAYENYQEAEDLYNEGVIDYLQLIDAELNYTTAEFGYLSELYNYKIALITLYHSLGEE